MTGTLPSRKLVGVPLLSSSPFDATCILTSLFHVDPAISSLEVGDNGSLIVRKLAGRLPLSSPLVNAACVLASLFHADLASRPWKWAMMGCRCRGSWRARCC